jgi:hypothetical protein
MSLAAQAEADLATVLESSSDFGVPFTLTDPDEFSSAEQLFGRFSDVGQVMDPGTGAMISGRHATLTVRISTLTAAGYSELPEGIIDESSLPWIVEAAGPSTPLQKYSVAQTFPDRALGVVTMVLAFWNQV